MSHLALGIGRMSGALPDRMWHRHSLVCAWRAVAPLGHRQECLCHIRPGRTPHLCQYRGQMWHRHSCLCLAAKPRFHRQPRKRTISSTRAAARRQPTTRRSRRQRAKRSYFFESATALSTPFSRSFIAFCASPGFSSHLAISVAIAFSAPSYLAMSCWL
jgi:hypothetical protein